MPGYESMMALMEVTEKKLAKNHKLFLLHSGIDYDDVSVFDRQPESIRKIILSTNIAETSITIEDIVIIMKHFVSTFSR